MGELKNCPVCGKIFVRVTRNLCPDCIEKEEEEFEVVREYIKNCNCEPTVEKISEAVGVEEKKILKWAREGRIEFNWQGSLKGVTCKRCGVDITIGEYCPNCVKFMVSQLQSMPKGQSADKKPTDRTRDSKNEGMFVANRIRNKQ